MKFKLLVILVMFGTLRGHAQNAHKKWYFGDRCSLDFMSNPPMPINSSTMTVAEGCASVADQAGSLLFYTDGSTVWNQQNQVMANGTNINQAPGQTPSQSCLIVKQPASTSIYYIFTMQGFLTPLGYSIVDISLAAGMGSVTVKSATLFPGFKTAEKLIGTKHCNNQDCWIVTRAAYPAVFYAYLLTAAGINTTAVVSTLSGDTIVPSGYMKISPNGKKIALVCSRSPGPPFKVAVHDFDNATGIVSSNSIVISGFPSNTAGGAVYGIEFSPDGSRLYVSTGLLNAFLPQLYQFNLCAGNEAAVNASKYIVNFDSTVATGGAIQLAPDGKIYKSRYNKQTLGVINNPNLLGAACNYNNSQQALGSTDYGTWGLPNFITSDLNAAPQTQFSYALQCQDVFFTGTPGVGPDNYCPASSYWPLASNWDFGDPASGVSNTSTLTNPVHHYAALGTYTTQLILTFACRTDTFRQQVTISNLNPSFSITGQPAICKNHTGTLSAVTSTSQGALTYSWSPSNATSTLVSVSPTATTVYTVTGTNASGCKVTNTVQLTVSPCLGINEQGQNGIANIYPNPNDGSFYIESATNLSFSIYNQLGEFVSGGKAIPGKQAVDVSHLANGIYFMKLSDGKDEKMLKLVKGD